MTGEVHSAGADERLRAERDEARQWARHGYEIGQRSTLWSDHGVAPAWLTEGWPRHFDADPLTKAVTQLDELLSGYRAALARPNAGPDVDESDRLRAELAETRAAGDAMLSALVDHFRHLPLPGTVNRAMRDLRRSVRGDAPAPAEPPADEPSPFEPDGEGGIRYRDEPPAAVLPVTLSSVDDVAAVCLAHGIGEVLMVVPGHRRWRRGETQVDADDDGFSIGWSEEWGAVVSYGTPSALLVAAIEAARGGSR